MSGLKIGELFMDLGFEVDDKTLKSFNSTINETLSGMLRLAGVSASVAGFVSIMTGASDTALALRNMNKEFGYSTEGMQRWAAIVHQANPLVSHEQGLNSYRKMAEYIRNMQFGTGDAGFALGMFGGGVEDNTPEKIQERIRKGLPNVVKNYGQGKASEWVDQITGGVGAINAFTMSIEDLQKAAENGKRALKDDNQLIDMRLQTSALKEQWDVFIDHIAASLAPGTTKVLKNINDKGVWDTMKKIGKHFEGDWDYGGDFSNSKMSIPSGSEALEYLDKRNNKKESMHFWLNRGYTKAQAAGFLSMENAESKFNPHPTPGDGGTAFGSFQMHWDKYNRAQNILAATGIDVRNADHYNQLEGALWDFEHSGLKEQFKRINNPEDAAAFLSRKWERPGDADGEAAARAKDAGNIYNTSVTAPITIHSTAPAQDVAYHAVSELNKQLIDTSAQTDLGPSH